MLKVPSSNRLCLFGFLVFVRSNSIFFKGVDSFLFSTSRKQLCQYRSVGYVPVVDTYTDSIKRRKHWRNNEVFLQPKDEAEQEEVEKSSSAFDVPSNSTKSAVASVASTKVASYSSDPQLKKTKIANRWDSFDYEKHWYPVTWARDVLENKPTMVTLFDVDYVVARDSQGRWSALQDKCPHKSAKLSEGRMTSSGFIQCAYHGWSYNGTSGNCVQIPQAGPGVTTYSSRTCAKAIPIREWQGMVWLWPGPQQVKYPNPPTVPELDYPDWQPVHIVRDFPVDWSLLLSNIMDPDHGMYAHTALPFDYYSASPDYPLSVNEAFENGGWTLSTRVPAVDKLLAVDREKRLAAGQKVKPKKEPAQSLDATTLFQAPTTVSLCRRDENNATKFVTAFWVCPVGTGRSRFMSVGVGKLPIKIPRWIFQLNTNRFLDQDTMLVASQQPPVLSAEAEGVEHPRQSLYAYGSASDRAVRLIDQFWDSTLSKAPNRKNTLQQLFNAGNLQHVPPREFVLDRYTQHLKICPDSQAFVANLKRVRNISLLCIASWLAKTMFQRTIANRWILIFSTLMAFVTEQLRRQFYFVKTEKLRDKDLSKIPVKAWLDP